jgi:hypothetical protein
MLAARRIRFMTTSNGTIITAALLPVSVYLTLVPALLVLQPFEVPAGVIPATSAVVTVASIAFANFLRLRRDRRGI